MTYAHPVRTDGGKKPQKLLDRLRDAIRARHYSIRTEKCYADWVRRFILFHNKRHPREIGAPEVEAFLTHLAIDRNVAASTQNQALAAILFLYNQVLDIDLPWLSDVTRAKRPERRPVVLTREEVNRVLDRMTGAAALVAKLLYGTGMRLMEGVRLRVYAWWYGYADVLGHMARIRDEAEQLRKDEASRDRTLFMIFTGPLMVLAVLAGVYFGWRWWTGREVVG